MGSGRPRTRRDGAGGFRTVPCCHLGLGLLHGSGATGRASPLSSCSPRGNVLLRVKENFLVHVRGLALRFQLGQIV